MRRRDFIRNLGLLGGSMAFGISGIPINAFSSPLLLNIEQTNGKILVLLQMSGGNDGLNTVIPFEDNRYYNFRPQIGIRKEEAVRLTDSTGLNPAMSAFQGLYEEGKLNIVQSVGYENHNRSHFRASDIWMSASHADQYIDNGWIGRYLDLVYPDSQKVPPKHPMAVQLGSVESMLLQSPIGSMSVVFENPNTFYQLISGTVTDDDVPEQTIAGAELAFLQQVSTQSVSYASTIKQAADKAKNTVTYPKTNLGRQLAIVASLIAGGLETPVYLANISGFDTHAKQLELHGNVLKQLSEAVAAFQQDIEQLGVADKVVLMTFSEFGRRVAENGSQGTDHGTAAPLFVIGKSLTGGIIGTNPDLGNLDRNGDLLHQFDYRQVYSTILQDHLGLDSAKTQQILGGNYQSINLFQHAYHRPVPAKNPYSPLALNRVFPNPMHVSATIEYEVRRSMRTKLSVVDMSGREVLRIQEGIQEAGYYTHDLTKSNLRSGTYALHLEGEGHKKTLKLVVL